jgi:hypothetical protein
MGEGVEQNRFTVHFTKKVTSDCPQSEMDQANQDFKKVVLGVKFNVLQSYRISVDLSKLDTPVSQRQQNQKQHSPRNSMANEQNALPCSQLSSAAAAAADAAGSE